MSSSESLELWSNNSNDNRDSTHYTHHHLNNSRTRTISSPHQEPIVNRSDRMTTQIIPPGHSSDSEVSNLVPSYIEILPDWLASYDTLPQEEIIEDDKNMLHRRTFHHATSQQKQPVLVRKAKSLRDTSKSTSRLRSPPPPPHISNQEPRLPDKMQFMNKVKRKLSLNSNRNPSVASLQQDQEECLDNSQEPRRTTSSSILSHGHKPTSATAMNNGLSEYQGYSRPTSKHRSFTYSPPPPRTSSLQASNIPAVPPMPPAPKIQELQSRSSSLKKKKSESFHSDKSESIVQPTRTSSLKKKSESFHHENKPPLPHSRSSSLKKAKNNNDILTDTSIQPIYTPPLPATNYALNMSHDLAQIEEDIKALEIQRDRHSSFVNAAELQQVQQQLSTQVTGRKRGKTLPGSLATPPPIPTLPLPPMTLNPIQLTIPNNLQKKPTSSAIPTMRQSTSTGTSSTNKINRIKLSSLSSMDDHFITKHSPQQHNNRNTNLGLGLGSGGFTAPSLSRKSSLPNNALGPPPPPTRKSHTTGEHHRSSSHSHSHSHSNHYHRAEEDPNTPVAGARSPKSVHTALKYYGQYLSEYERQLEIQDYAHIYFVGPHALAQKHGSPTPYNNYGFDDDRGDYRVVMQDHLAYRYQVLDVLGRGSFGQVVKCFDHKTAQTVAIKLIRNKKRFHAQAITEVNILKKLVEWDPHDQYHTVQMTDHFYFRQHLCIAFECLSMNLYEFIKSNHFQGFSLSLIKRITIQILQCLTLLAEHQVIHCDLKPENIMLKHPAKNSIKVIDFGSSCFESEKVYTYIQSRFYRSPEVILGLSYHKSIDMWSVGCIMAELYTGLPLFPGENEQEQLACIMEIMGLPDRHLVERCSRRKLFFDSMGYPRIIANSKDKKRLPATRTLFQALKCHDVVFIDFVECCLRWDPAKRMTPQEALQHEWITQSRNNTPQPISLFLSSSAMMHHHHHHHHHQQQQQQLPILQRKSSMR